MGIFNEYITDSKSSIGPPGVGFKLTPDENYNIQNKRLVNVANPIDQQDSVNRRYLERDNIIQNHLAVFKAKQYTDKIHSSKTVVYNISKTVIYNATFGTLDFGGISSTRIMSIKPFKVTDMLIHFKDDREKPGISIQIGEDRPPHYREGHFGGRIKYIMIRNITVLSINGSFSSIKVFLFRDTGLRGRIKYPHSAILYINTEYT